MKSILAVLVLIVFIFVGCTTGEISRSPAPATSAPTDNSGESPISSEEPHEVKETISNLGVYNIETARDNKYQTLVTEFDLGKKEYLSKAGKIMPYSIRGIIGIPEGDGPFPLILITHGSHSNDDESKRFDTGFDYLVKDLAENGYVAVSMDMSKPYIWKYGDNDDNEKSIPVASDHIESLIRANEGNNPGYTADLKGKIDFEKLGLIGHSRGGETIFDIAADQASSGLDIKAMLSIAPTFFFDREWPGSDIAIIVPEYDGDLIQLDGFNTFRALNLNSKGSHFVTLLMKGNHNYFNRNIIINDALMAKSEEVDDQLTREQQEGFLMDYAVGFFNSSLLGNCDNFINVNSPQPNRMYGFDVKSMYRTGQAVDLVDVKVTDNFKAEGASIEATIDSWFYKDDKVLIDTITAGLEPYNTRPLINIKWENSGSRVIISPNEQDFSKYDALAFNMVIDSADELNKRDTAQQFTVELKDTMGNTSRIVLPENLNALGYTPGKIDYTPLGELNLYYWSNVTPLSCINLPLSGFENIDLKHIESIALILDKTSSGSLYIDSIILQ